MFKVASDNQLQKLLDYREADARRVLEEHVRVVLPGEIADLRVVLTKDDVRGVITLLLRSPASYAVFVDGDHHSGSLGDLLILAGLAESFPGRVFGSGESLAEALTRTEKVGSPDTGPSVPLSSPQG
jgi:hypothetical protein